MKMKCYGGCALCTKQTKKKNGNRKKNEKSSKETVRKNSQKIQRECKAKMNSNETHILQVV